MAFVDALQKLKTKDESEFYNKVFFMDDYFVVMMPQSLYLAANVETSNFSLDQARELNGWYLPLDAWATLVKAETVELGKVISSEISAEVTYEHYKSEIFFQKMQPNMTDAIKGILRNYQLLEQTHSRASFSLGSNEVSAYLSLKPADVVYVQAIKENENVMFLSDAGGLRMLYHAPYYEQPLMMLEMFKVAAKSIVEPASEPSHF